MKNRRIAIGTLAIAAAAALVMGTSPRRAQAQAIWAGPSGSPRGDGDWNTGGNWTGGTGAAGVPGSADNTYIQGISQTSPADPTTAHITIGDGLNPYTASVAYLDARYGKTATITINDQATLNVAGILDSGGYNDAAASHLTIQGASGASVSADIHRIYLERALAAPNTLTFSNITVTLSSDAAGTYTNVSAGNALTVADGATLNGSAYYIRNPNGSNITRMTIQDGTVTGSSIIYNYQLLQLASAGKLSLTGAGQDLYVYSGGRFEAEGTGLNSNVSTRVLGGGTLAIGLMDPLTHTRTAASTLTLNASTELDGGSRLEFGIFGAGGANTAAADSLAGVRNDLLNVNGQALTSTLSLLDIVTYGYTPHAGAIYQLTRNDNTAYAFNTTNITDDWTIFRQDDGANGHSNLYVQYVPEPASLTLLGLGAGALLLKRRRRS
jgi:hypothetical protein